MFGLQKNTIQQEDQDEDQLTQIYDQTKKEIESFEKQCEQFCIQEYQRGQEDAFKMMLQYCSQNGDIRKMNIQQLIQFLILKRNQLTNFDDTQNDMQQCQNNKKLQLNYSEQTQMLSYNLDRLLKNYEALEQ